MCSPIRFTRPGARATRTGVAGQGGGSNARANAAARGVEAMGVAFSLKQVLRACGAQDDKPARFSNRKVRRTPSDAGKGTRSPRNDAGGEPRVHHFGGPCVPTACTSWPVARGCYTWASRTTSSGGWMSTSAASPPASRLRTTSVGSSTLSSSRTYVTRLLGKKRSKAGGAHGRCACSKSATLPGKTWQIAGSRRHASHDDLHLLVPLLKTRASEGPAVYAGASSRTALPAAVRFPSFISEYLRDSSTPWAPP